MTEPEIARRCPACGVSIREAAFFCPQCGVGLTQQDFDRTQPLFAPTLEYTIAETAPTVAGRDDEPRQDSPQDFPANNSPTEPLRDATGQSATETVVDVPVVETAKASTAQAALGAVGAGIQRATTMARGVEGGVVQRAQKMRKISGVVIDEAAYDPSLRFVLVAAVLFILFLVIVLLNKVIV